MANQNDCGKRHVQTHQDESINHSEWAETPARTTTIEKSMTERFTFRSYSSLQPVLTVLYCSQWENAFWAHWIFILLQYIKGNWEKLACCNLTSAVTSSDATSMYVYFSNYLVLLMKGRGLYSQAAPTANLKPLQHNAEVEKRKRKEIQRSEVLNKSNCCCIWWTWREMNGWFVMLIKAEPSVEQDSLAARPCTDISNWCYQHGNRAAFAAAPLAL